MSFLEGFLWGALGGVLVELLFWYKIRYLKPKDRPHYLNSLYYWILTIFMTVAGGILVIVYLESQVSLTPILAINIGASAPLGIGAAANSSARISPGRIDSEDRVKIASESINNENEDQ